MCKRQSLFFFHLFLLIGGSLLHNISVDFVIHWHESAMDLHVFPIPIPPPTSLSTRFLWVFPVHQPRALVSCIPSGLVICFTLDNIHAVLSKHPTLAFSHRVQKSVLYIHLCLFFCFAYRVIINHLSKFHIYVLVCCTGLYLSGLLHFV